MDLSIGSQPSGLASFALLERSSLIELHNANNLPKLDPLEYCVGAENSMAVLRPYWYHVCAYGILATLSTLFCIVWSPLPAKHGGEAHRCLLNAIDHWEHKPV